MKIKTQSKQFHSLMTFNQKQKLQDREKHFSLMIFEMQSKSTSIHIKDEYLIKILKN